MTFVRWKIISGYEGCYEISEDGRVWSRISKRFLKFGTSVGYHFVNLQDGSHTRSIKVHRLVAETFLPQPRDYAEVNHKNGVKTDNRVANLEWCSRAQNNAHAWRTGARTVTERMRKAFRATGHAKRRLSMEDVRQIKRSADSPRVLGVRFKLSARSIRDILNGITYKEIQ